MRVRWRTREWTSEHDVTRGTVSQLWSTAPSPTSRRPACVDSDAATSEWLPCSNLAVSHAGSAILMDETTLTFLPAALVPSPHGTSAESFVRSSLAPYLSATLFYYAKEHHHGCPSPREGALESA